jgi:AcrR family transcriptional regulator
LWSVTTSSTRWRRRKQARPQEILAAALDVFGERGYAAARLDEVARRAGVTKGTLYLYFPNKEELFKAVIRETLVPALMRLGEASGPARSATARFEDMMEEFPLLAASPLGALPKLIAAEAGNFPELARFYLDEVVARGLGAVRAILRHGIETGEFRAVDLEHAPFCIIAPLVIGLLWSHSLGRVAERPLDLPALGRAQLDLLFNGLRPKDHAPCADA